MKKIKGIVANKPGIEIIPNYSTTFKKSNRRSFWQIKRAMNEYYSFTGFHYFLNDLLSDIGFDINNKDTIYTLLFGINKMKGYHLMLEKIGIDSHSVKFKIIENTVNSSYDSGYLPKEMFEKMTYNYNYIYLKFEVSDRKGIVFLQENYDFIS